MGWVAYTNQGVPKGGPTLDPLTISTSLPASPTIGKEILFQTAAMAALTPPVAWRLYYDGSKWIPTGGPPLLASVTTEQATSAAGNTYQDLGTVGPSLTIPVLGTYSIQVGAECFIATGLANAMALFMSYSIAGAGATDADAFRIDWSNAGTGGRMCPVSIPGIKTVATGDTIVAKYRDGSANHAATFGKRWLRIIPLRLG